MKIIIKGVNGNIEKEFDANVRSTLLSQIRDQGVELQSACLMGMCGACMCHIEKGGEFVIKDKKTEPAFPLDDNEVMTCIGGVKKGEGEIVLRKIY